MVSESCPPLHLARRTPSTILCCVKANRNATQSHVMSDRPKLPTARQGARGQGAPLLEALQATSCPTASTRAKPHTRYEARLARVSAVVVCQRHRLTRTTSIAQVRTWFKTLRIDEQHRILGQHMIDKQRRTPIYCYVGRLSHKHDKICQ